MVDTHQISMDEYLLGETVRISPGRHAFIDESGGFGFDFSKHGTESHFIICAVVLKNDQLDDMRGVVERVKRNNGINNAELKSSSIGNNTSRRNKILTELLEIDFQIIALVADKRKFIQESPLTEYKKSFLKFLHKQVYNLLYRNYPKLRIIEDETGSKEFQDSFKEYIENNRPEYNLFNQYDFDYTDSKNEALVQLADFVAGCIRRAFVLNEKQYLEILKRKILTIDFFPHENEPYWGKTSAEESKYNKDVYTVAQKKARDYIAKHDDDESKEKRAQIAFLKYLLFYVQNINPLEYVYSNQIVDTIESATGERISRDFLYRRIIAQLRDNGVIIASCPHGYKIPISVEDLYTYIKQTHSVVSPMLHRVEICRSLVLAQTDLKLDILNDPAFSKYKKYFD